MCGEWMAVRSRSRRGTVNRGGGRQSKQKIEMLSGFLAAHSPATRRAWGMTTRQTAVESVGLFNKISGQSSLRDPENEGVILTCGECYCTSVSSSTLPFGAHSPPGTYAIVKYGGQWGAVNWLWENYCHLWDLACPINRNKVTRGKNSLLEIHPFLSSTIFTLNDFVGTRRFPMRVVTNF